jgi:hypothetical protein
MSIYLKAVTHNQSDFPMVWNCKMNISFKFLRKGEKVGRHAIQINETSFVKQNFRT